MKANQDNFAHANHPISPAHSWKMTMCNRYPELGPRIVLFSGGTGARELSKQLIRYTHRSSHILPMFDDGGSSRHIRKWFNIPPPGDLRNRMMAIADTSEGGNPAVQKLFNTRFPADGEQEKLRQELNLLVQGKHALMHSMEKRFKQLILSYLQEFSNHLPIEFDLRGGNLGNFIITGGLLVHRNIDTVLYILQELVKVRGRIIPVCEGNYFLRAILSDGSLLDSQQRITKESHLPVQEIRYLEKDNKDFKEIETPVASPYALSVIRRSDMLVFSMGSFFTSILPVLGVKGIGDAIRKATVPKIFIANATTDPESEGFSFHSFIQTFHRTLAGKDYYNSNLKDYIHYVICDSQKSHLPERLEVSAQILKEMGLQVFDGPYLDDRNHYVPERIIKILMSIL